MPQHHSVWSSRMPQVVAPLALTLAQPSVPTTWGTIRSLVWPSPTWPYAALPQHYREVSERTSQVDCPPELTIGFGFAAVRTNEP